MFGLAGLCSVYDPPVSYWCSEYTSGGGAFVPPLLHHAIYTISPIQPTLCLYAVVLQFTGVFLHSNAQTLEMLFRLIKWCDLVESMCRIIILLNNMYLQAFRTPSGVTPNQGALPNAPYKDVSQALYDTVLHRCLPFSHILCFCGVFSDHACYLPIQIP